jgi:hypothetical protein
MRLTGYEYLTLIMTIVGLLLIPTIGLLVRLVVKWTRTEYRLESLAEDIKELMTQAREDRGATNQRLRWLEENVWNMGKEDRNALRNQGRR